jgi:hypothetical protein
MENNDSYNYDQDPFAEPEDTGYFLIPEGLHPAKIKEAEFTSDENGVLQNIKIVFEFDQFKGNTDYPWINTWFYVTSPLGKHTLTAALDCLGVPSEVPDPRAIRKDTKTPRKTFSKAMKDEVTGAWTDEQLKGREALVSVYHTWRCPDCGVTNPMNILECKGKKDVSCGYRYDSSCKIWPQVDRQSIHPSTDEHTNAGLHAEDQKQASESEEDDLPF